MVIYSRDFGELKKLKPLCNSILSTLEWFAKEMGNLPGAKRILEPLWNDAWSEQPRFWSIIGEIKFAKLLIEKSKMQILGFDLKISTGDTTANIVTVFQGKKVNIDIEIQNIKKEFEESEEKLRSFIEYRSSQKISDKFAKLSSCPISSELTPYLSLTDPRRFSMS